LFSRGLCEATARRSVLHEEHVRAHVAEEHRAVGPRHRARQIENANPVERRHGESELAWRPMRIEEIACVSSGDGAHVVTLLHGVATTKETFDGLARELEPRARVLRFDMRGHGASASPDGPWTLDDLAADVTTVLDAHRVQRTILVGHSAGGVVAMRFAIE